MDRVIDKVCDEFEKTWQNRRPVRIEDVVDSSDVGRRDELLHQLICLEIELRQKAGETPKTGDYHVRFPEDTSLNLTTSSSCDNLSRPNYQPSTVKPSGPSDAVFEKSYSIKVSPHATSNPLHPAAGRLLRSRVDKNLRAETRRRDQGEDRTTRSTLGRSDGTCRIWRS